MPFLVPHTPSVEIVPEPLLHVPKAELHPAPQWVVVEPQKPPEEQQVPNVEPLQVFPFLAQDPSVDMLLLLASQVPKDAWQPALQWVSVEPQKPCDEQQSPKPEPLQVLPFLPHVPSVDMLPLPLVQVPNPD